MGQTFEELIGPEIDGLYRGALFLTGGEPDEAERLLTDTLTGSFRAFRASQVTRGDDFKAQLDDRLLERFVRTLPSDLPSPYRHEALPATGIEELGAEAILARVATLPGWARAALWLVQFRRIGYESAGERLGVGPAELNDLLAYRSALVAAVEDGGSHRTGKFGG